MASIIDGFEYDIFISYRHNDNRSGWVTEFVNALQEELAATIKEQLSIYFDKNPHDGLLETHNVDKSLEGKLKCLIFIPIISQTYCDTKSFAWQHEFVAFNKLASEDQFGRDIKLGNGNVASRILPIKIHDLDPEDKTTIENEIGGVLRAIEFIYKEAAVNRPLKPTDSKTDNQNKTDYRNQTNKIANAIKEILGSLKNPSPPNSSENIRQSISSPPNPKTKFILAGAIVLLFIIAGYFLYPKILSSPRQKEGIDKSIAVLPFVDLSESKDQEWFSDGLSEEIINSLFQIKDLELRGRNSSFAFKGKKLTIGQLADSLHVNYLVEGSVRRFGENLRVTVQLIRTHDDVHIWSKEYDQKFTDVFQIQTDIANNVARSLNVYLNEEEKTKMLQMGTQNVDAYEAFLKGRKLYYDWHSDRGDARIAKYEQSLWPANDFFDRALQLDSSIALAYYYRADSYVHMILSGMSAPLNRSLSIADAEIERDDNYKAAIRFSKDPTVRLILELTYAKFHPDYVLMAQLVDKLTMNFKPNPLLSIDFESSAISLFAGPETALRIIMDDLTMHPQNHILQYARMHALITLNRLDEAQAVLETITKSELALEDGSVLLRLLKGEKASISNSILMIDKENPLGLALKGLPFDEKKLIDAPDSDLRVFYDCWVYWQSGQPQKANQLISKMDAELQPEKRVFWINSLGWFSNYLPFDLNAAPNFKKALTDAHVDLKRLRTMPVF